MMVMVTEAHVCEQFPQAAALQIFRGVPLLVVATNCGFAADFKSP